MAKQFHLLKVATIRSDTKEAIQIGFRVPKVLKSLFVFDPGQYLTLKVEMKGKLLRRAYSICSPIQEETISVLVKRLKGGRVSNYLNDHIKIGDQFEIMPPGGHFKLSVNKNQRANYYFIGAGSGITPLVSMIQSILEEEPESFCYLLYGNRDEDNIIFKNKLNRLRLVYSDRFILEYILSKPKLKKAGGFLGFFPQTEQSWKGKTGRINEQVIKSFFENNKKEKIKGYYICGPGKMIEVAVNALQEMGIDKSLIHREYFNSTDLVSKEEEQIAKVIKKTPSKVIVTLEGIKNEINISDGSNIVQALIDKGVEPPYSCLSGTCSTCMAILTKGEVSMDVSIGLEDDEKEKGYILTCQSHPTTDEVELSYDIE